MSGTSLDGLDICCVKFTENTEIKFDILKAKTISYSDEWKEKLSAAHLLNGRDLMQLNHDFGVFCGERIKEITLDLNQTIDFIASHGHTVFHSPSTGFTTQIGSGASIYAATGIKTICDFRSVDVAFGGQGAPLVPIGDLLLYASYHACLNLGGIANISLKSHNQIVAQDLGYCNLILNHLTKTYFDLSYDDNGNLGKQGKINEEALKAMLIFTKNKEGRSLAREDFEHFIKLLSAINKPEDALRTSYEYIATFLSDYCNTHSVKDVFITGGGAHNSFLIELTQSKTKSKLIIPSSENIDFKEALVFAFLGLLRLENKNNSLKSVTKASQDSVSGAVYG